MRRGCSGGRGEATAVASKARGAAGDEHRPAYLARAHPVNKHLPTTDGPERKRNDGERWGDLPRHLLRAAKVEGVSSGRSEDTGAAASDLAAK